MSFLGYPWQIWAASFIAVLVKLRFSEDKKTMSFLGVATTIVVALFSGIIFYNPIVEAFGLGENWNVTIAILVSLTAENIMRGIVEISEDKDFVRDWLIDLIKKKDDNK